MVLQDYLVYARIFCKLYFKSQFRSNIYNTELGNKKELCIGQLLPVAISDTFIIKLVFMAYNNSIVFRIFYTIPSEYKGHRCISIRGRSSCQ